MMMFYPLRDEKVQSIVAAGGDAAAGLLRLRRARLRRTAYYRMPNRLRWEMALMVREADEACRRLGVKEAS